MKKLVALALVGIAFTACKNDYECTCTVTETDTDGSIMSYTETTEIRDVKGSVAKNNSDCLSYENSYTHSNGQVEIYKRSCEVEKL